MFFVVAQSLSCVQIFVATRTRAYQASLSSTSWSLLKFMSIKSVMPSNLLILCRPLLFLPSIFPSIRVFSNESVLCIRWPKHWSFNFSLSLSTEYSGLISLRIDWLDLLAGQGTFKSLLRTTIRKHRFNAVWGFKSHFNFIKCDCSFYPWISTEGWKLLTDATKHAAKYTFQVLLTITPIILPLSFPTLQPMKAESAKDKMGETFQGIHLGKGVLFPVKERCTPHCYHQSHEGGSKQDPSEKMGSLLWEKTCISFPTKYFCRWLSQMTLWPSEQMKEKFTEEMAPEL